MRKSLLYRGEFHENPQHPLRSWPHVKFWAFWSVILAMCVKKGLGEASDLRVVSFMKMVFSVAQ